MNAFRSTLLAAAAGVVLAISGKANPIISTSSTTFLDQTTGLTWDTVDTFWGESENQIVSSLVGTGFSLANESQVATLFADAGEPTNPSDYIYLAQVMGGAYSGGAEPGGRDIIWGDYYSTDTTEGWAWAFGASDGYSGWSIDDEGYPLTSTYSDLGAWVVQSGPVEQAPDSASSALLLALGAAALLIGVARSRRLGFGSIAE